MDNFILAIEAVIPMFTLMFIGLMVKRRKMLSSEELTHVNRMIFQVFFSIMMFYNIYTADLSSTIRPKLMLFAAAGILVMYLITFAGVVFAEKSNKRRGAMIQAIFRSNFVLMGIPLVANIFGTENIGVTTMMIAVVVPIYNVLAVFTLETFRGGKFNLVKILLGVLKNPMILGALIATAFLIIGIKVPNVLLKALGQITAATTPIALIILGASFRLGSTMEHRWPLVSCLLGRLIIVPAIFLSVAAYLGFRGVEFVTLIGIFCTPCAVASFAMAQQMDSDSELAGNCVIFSSGISCITIFCWVLFFKYLGMF